jgi:hypothetical protein
MHLNSWKEVGKVYQLPAGFNRQYCRDMMEGRIVGLGPPPQEGPEYGFILYSSRLARPQKVAINRKGLIALAYH